MIGYQPAGRVHAVEIALGRLQVEWECDAGRVMQAVQLPQVFTPDPVIASHSVSLLDVWGVDDLLGVGAGLDYDAEYDRPIAQQGPHAGQERLHVACGAHALLIESDEDETAGLLTLCYWPGASQRQERPL